MTEGATILIADDLPENISILYQILSKCGHHVLVAQSGDSALRITAEQCPDLIILDVMMPGLDGFNTCRKLKENPANQNIPVIFMSALNEIKDKLTGFEAGGVDYIGKPVAQEEVLARVNTHLQIHRLQRELSAKNQALQQANQSLRDKNAELEAFSHTVAHDLKNPLNVILNFAQALKDNKDNLEAGECYVFLNDIYAGAEKMLDIIDALLLLAGTSRSKPPHLDSLDMQAIVEKALQRLDSMSRHYQAQLEVAAQWPAARGYPAWVEEVWVNYISNALKYGGHPPRLQIGAEIIEEGKSARFWVRDNGPGLSEDDQKRLFTPFTRLHKGRAEGHGLGLSIVQRILERLGGHAGVESRLREGSLFYFVLPLFSDEP